MFTLLNPTALLALLGLLVPVAIHLWNRRPGREVPVGSLRWLAAGANRRLRNLKPEQLWLLLLRAALLAMLAVGLAGPVWRQRLPAGRGQVLLSPEVLGSPALAAVRPTIDSLRRRGYGLRWLAAGFPKMSGAAWRASTVGPRDSARLLGAGATSGFGWARVQQAADAFAGQPLYVVTPAGLKGFQGPHPPLRAGITWQALPAAAAAAWLQEATQHGDSLALLLGKSTETQTTFYRTATLRPQQQNQLLPMVGMPPLRLQAGPDGSPTLVPEAAPAAARPALPVRLAPPLKVTIYASPAYAQDARYLRAGIHAAAAGLAVPPIVELTTSPPATGPQWLFWLSDEPLPEQWREAVRQGTNVWQEAVGPGVADATHLVPQTTAETPAVLLRRGSAAVGTGSQPVWVDGQARAVLTKSLFGRGAFYRLHTRLNSHWSNLADNPALPARLLLLLHPDNMDAPAADQLAAAYDVRAIDPAQLAFQRGNTGAAKTNVALKAPAAATTADLRPWLVLAAGLLFGLERLLASRRENQALNSTL